MLRKIVTLMTLIVILAASMQANGQTTVVPRPEVSKKDSDEADRLITLSKERVVKAQALVAATVKHETAMEAMIKGGPTSPMAIRSLQQQSLRMMDEIITLLDEHDALLLKASQLLKLPPDSFKKLAWSKEKKAEFEENNKEVRASMRKSKGKAKSKTKKR